MAEHSPQTEYTRKTEHGIVITEAGHEALRPLVTSTTDNVYGILPDASPVMVAAAMARLSRRAGDLRATLLDEFIGKGTKDADLIRRVVTAYGDDSVQQLVGVQFVVENASIILTKLLEWGRLGSYLEQSTRYIYFDQRGSDGKYNFYTPERLPADIRGQYDQTLTRIFELYSKMVHEATVQVRQAIPEPTDRKDRVAWLGATRAQACDTIRPVLPAATRSTVGFFSSAQAFESLVIHLLSEPLPEAVQLGQQLLEMGRQIIPSFLERTDLPERGGASVAYRANTRTNVRDLAKQLLAGVTAPPVEGMEVKLVNHWPQQEDDILAELLFESSDLPLEVIRHQVEKLKADDKAEIFRTYIGERLNRRHKPGRAFELPHLEWEVVGDYGTFRDLQRHRIVDAFEWQSLTPHNGYDVPESVVNYGLEADYRECFRLSEELYQLMTAAGFELEAQYVPLLGHRMRYRFAINLRAFHHFVELRSQPVGHPGYRRIVVEMYRQTKELWPYLTAGMEAFVNQAEDPALTRLAAERATQDKLERLDQLTAD
jgi:thymidylate synthase ThyX